MHISFGGFISIHVVRFYNKIIKTKTIIVKLSSKNYILIVLKSDRMMD